MRLNRKNREGAIIRYCYPFVGVEKDGKAVTTDFPGTEEFLERIINKIKCE